jgi:hypothetical protein
VLGVAADSSKALYPIGGELPQPLPHLDEDFFPVQWSEDGLSLYGYHLGEFPCKVYKINVATGKASMVQELRPTAPAGVVLIAPVVVSHDGTRFAYSYNQTLSALYLVSGLH